MTARETLLLFGIGVPIASVLLILVDRLGRTGGRFVPRRYDEGGAVSAVSAGTISADPVVARRDSATVLPEPDAEPDAVHAVHAVPAVHALVASLRPPRPVQRPWAPGDGLRRPLSGGAVPSEATVRKRAWTTYSVIAPRDIFGIINAERLERGRPPLRFNPLQQVIEPMQVDIDDVGRVRVHWAEADEVVDPYEISRTR